VVECIVALRESGFRVALDDFVPESSAERLLPLADIVKIDVLQIPADAWPALVTRLHDLDLLVVAEKVEDAQTHERALEAGFDLFQGYLYARPTDQPSMPMSPRHAICLRLLTALAQDDIDLVHIEELVSSDAVLTVRTLRMANSAAAGAGRTIGSVHQALVLVGPGTLSGWIALMLVAGQDSADVVTSVEVLVRARACQLVATARGTSKPGVAFLAGLLPALVEATGLSSHQMLDTIGASDEIRRAVLDGTDELGRLVRDVDRHVSGFDLGAPLDVQMSHLAAVVWGHDLVTLG
jgi:EAL and modified HD-GYP domain-containing signal transduction protein